MNISDNIVEYLNYFIVFSFSLFFIIYSLIHKRYRNVILFVTLALILKLAKLSLINSIVVAYVLCLIYGIVMNYHLMDNFENNSGKNSKNQEFFSERILFKYINERKKNNPNFVITRSSRIHDLKPIKSNISLDKMNAMKKNNKISTMPVLITNDNYIVDGHLRWYIHKSKSKGDKNLNSNDPRDFIKSNILSVNYKEFIRDIQIFKNETNFSELSRFKIDRYKLHNAKKALTAIQENVNLLSNYYKDLEKLDMV